MSFLPQYEIDQFKGKLVSDLSVLGKIYKAKKSTHYTLSVDHSRVDDMIADGWEIVVERKKMATKTKVKKPKSHSTQFEDDIWCQLYELGYRHLNYDEQCAIPYAEGAHNKQQVDVVAIDKETVLLVECKSSQSLQKAPSFKEVLESLPIKLDGFRKTIEQAFGRGRKVKYIFATRNLRIDPTDVDYLRLRVSGSFYYGDNTFTYINSLLKSYKGVATYQFLGLLFKNELINQDRIEIPAVEGDMGDRKYYMFSIEPKLLLKMSFIMHRTRANVEELPTYQRLLVSKRLGGITKFIDEGGYFPNSLILNFSQQKHDIQFEPSSKLSHSSSRFGTLKIPNAYAIAYIIDGQHRLYGYANSKYKDTDTIPVVAFNRLPAEEQLKTFMDINQNQKAVSPSLKHDLEEDLYWLSPKAELRMKALKSSIVKGLSNTQDSPLLNKITIGEDSSVLSMKAFITALSQSGLIPYARGNKYSNGTNVGLLYNIANQNHEVEMKRARKNVVRFLIQCYEFVADHYPGIFERPQYFIVSVRGTFAFVRLIGLLNTFLSEINGFTPDTQSHDRFEAIKPFLHSLLEGLSNITPEEEERQLTKYGTGAESQWLSFFQSLVNTSHPDYNPPELISWREKNDVQLQDEGRKYIIAVEKYIKKAVIDKLKLLFKDNWTLEINDIYQACMKRAGDENTKNYKEQLSKSTVEWTEMFTIVDYKKILESYWTKVPEDESDRLGFKTFEKEFTIDVGHGIHGLKHQLKWITIFNSHRNILAHEGSKETGLNKEEVMFLRRIYDYFFSTAILKPAS